MRKLKVILWTVLFWLPGTCAYVYYYGVTILASPEGAREYRWTRATGTDSRIIRRPVKQLGSVNFSAVGRRRESFMSLVRSSKRRKYLSLFCAISGLALLTTSTLLSSAQKSDSRAVNTDPPVPDAAELQRLYQRPLNLPTLHRGQPCPVSKGSRDTVPHVGYIFCSECLYFGKGPAYFALVPLFLTHPADNVAEMNLDNVFYRDGDAYSAKTPWVSRMDYTGPILARGQRLEGNGKLKFHFDGGGTRDLQLEAPVSADRSHWSFWPTSLVVPGPGCYGIQIDTAQGTDVVVVEAIRGSAPTRSGNAE